MGDYTLKNYNLDEGGILHPLAGDLGLEAVGISLSHMPPATGYPYFHAHKEQEEIFICLKGTGTMLVGDEEIAMKAGDFLRISADVPRAVGNKTNEPCTYLILGGLPVEKYKSDDKMFLISDGVEMRDKACEWSS
jgi:uncharacterized cupin superfamily protein